MKKHNLVFVDVETTGLNPNLHEIIEIGCVVVKQEKEQLKIVEEFNLKIKPEHLENAEKEALRINKYDPNDWIFAYTLSEAMQIFSKKTESGIMVGHNICFDYSFIENAFRKTKIENKMHYHKLDTISISFAKLHRKNDIDRFSLQKLCEYFGIKNDRAHTALSDAKATFEIYKKLMEI